MTEVESEKPETAANLEDERALSAIEQLLGLGNTQGYVTYDDVMKAVPEAELNIEQLPGRRSLFTEQDGSAVTEHGEATKLVPGISLCNRLGTFRQQLPREQCGHRLWFHLV